MAELSARLAAPLPAGLEVGRGNVLFAEGSCDEAAGRVRRLSLEVGGRQAEALTLGVPPPGELRGSSWWQASVPIAAIAEAEDADVRLRAFGDGGELIAQLGSLRLVPGNRPALRLPPREPGLVAICLATHEPPPELLRVQIESIRAQTHSEWRCVISDDASSPSAWQAITEAVAGDERFELRRSERRLGIYRNFERALAALGPDPAYVAFADQDDRWHPEKLATLLAALGPEDVLAHSDARVVSADGTLIAPRIWPGAPPAARRLGDVLWANPVAGAGCLFRRSLLELALPFPALAGRAYHDRWIALVARGAGGLVRVDRPLYDYVQHEGSAMGHSRMAEGGRPAGEGRLRAARRRTIVLRARGWRPDWRAFHDRFLLRSVTEAQVLSLRLGDLLSAADRRALARVEALARSPRAQAALAARHALRAPRRRPGLEGALARAVAWRYLARLRALRSGAPSRRAARLPRVRRSAAPTVGLVVTRDNPEAGYGDYFTAQGLGAALAALGLRVRYLELDSRHGLGRVDAVISLLDRFPADRVPARATAVAWVRNWTDRWVGRPWFDAYDALYASSAASCALIAEHSGREAELLPLATDPDVFRPVEPDPGLACDVLFAGNHWGEERQAATVLPELSGRLQVRVFGHGWDSVPAMRPLWQGPLAHDRLPTAYSSAALVVDDSASHARPFGAVNARVFDALACGAAVASNDADGTRSLFGEDFPVWSDAADLLRLAGEARSRPPARDRYRDGVLAAHTFRHRAQQLLAGALSPLDPR